MAIKILKDLFNIPNIENDFWDMFVIDALIGNTDRHNGNQGLIYDCASYLNSTLSDEDISRLDNKLYKLFRKLRKRTTKRIYFKNI